MSNKINNFQIHTNSSIILFGLTISLIIVYLFFPIFPGNFYYDIGTILIYSGPLDKIPNGFALCDGTNNTPNLTDKFIIGAYTEDTVKHVETMNNDSIIDDWNQDGTNPPKQFIGPGLQVDNIEPTKVDKNIEQAFSRGNLPYVFGTTYFDTYRTHSERGTAFFKKYIYTNNDNLNCEADGGTVVPKPYYNVGGVDGPTVNVCNNDKTILTDANLKDRQVQIIDPTVIGARDKDDFSQYFDITNSLKLSTDTTSSIISETYSTGTGFRHIPVNRRLFRDFEDYTLYLNGQNSNYDVLPMNKSYNYHVYDRTVYNDPNNNNSSIGESSIFRNGTRFNQEYLNDFSYTTPYTNNPSFFKLAYIIKIK